MNQKSDPKIFRDFNKTEYIKECPKIKTVIHWYDLPENKVIKLNPQFQQKLLHKRYSNLTYGFKKKLAEKLSLTRYHLSLLSQLKSNFSVGSLKRIAKACHIPLRQIERKIIGFGRRRMIINPKFPFHMGSKEGVALRSIINSEGHISKQIGRSVMIRVPEIEMLKKTIKYSKMLLGSFRVSIKKTKDKATHEIFLPGELGDILVLSGLTRGRKSINNPHVPKDITTGSMDKKKVYLQWSLASEMECTKNSRVLKLTRYVNVSNIIELSYLNKIKEGCIYKNGIPKIILDRLSKYPPNLLIGEALMLKDFGIIRNPYIISLWKYKDGGISAAWSLPITNRKKISILYNKIGIPLKEKSEKVKGVLQIYK